MSVSPDALLAILAMAAATVACRLAGLVLPARLATTGRLGRAFEAMPVAILSAIVAPLLLTHGPADALAGLVVVGASLRLPLTAVILLGIAAAAGFRALF
ncbi:AzlD domain-containing protein [Zavarzinia sp.]|uniref:AzlD domain-containing protein n=1 Tax=Zavarzinia sp. TaxID=2027920 RepID=UPI003567F3EF